MVYRAMFATCSIDCHGFEPPNLHQCLQTCLQVYGSKRLSCHADPNTVNRCHTRGESEEQCAGKKVWKISTLVLKPRADITRSPKQVYQWPHEKNVCPPKRFLKKSQSQLYHGNSPIHILQANNIGRTMLRISRFNFSTLQRLNLIFS